MSNIINWLDELLKDIAKKIQLSKTDYNLARDRAASLAEHLGSQDNPLARYHPLLYPQGSFRIQATISSQIDIDDYDIDLMLELAIQASNAPDAVLDTVADAITFGKGQRYVVEKKRRCVRVDFANMHLDVTPAVREDSMLERTSWIFDIHPHRPDHILSNPEGFAQWFEERTFNDLALDEMRKAYVPLKPQDPIEDKSNELLSLQLIKRWRNLLYPNEDARPPSVVLADLVAETPKQRSSLVNALIGIVHYMKARIAMPDFEIRNPRCNHEKFTDRWPKTDAARDRFAKELAALEFTLTRLRDNTETLDLKRNVLRKLFGEAAANIAFDSVNRRFGQRGDLGTLAYGFGTGAIGSNLGATPGRHEATVPKHRFYGSDRDV